jgi:hypothetical protein
MIFFLQSCFLTKVITTPVRVVGAVSSAIPVVGETIDDSLEVGVDAIDVLPI